MQMYYNLYLLQQFIVHHPTCELLVRVNSALVPDLYFPLRISNLLVSQVFVHLLSSALRRLHLLLLFSAELKLSEFQFFETSKSGLLYPSLSFATIKITCY
jgi:hypothetical protein